MRIRWNGLPLEIEYHYDSDQKTGIFIDSAILFYAEDNGELNPVNILEKFDDDDLHNEIERIVVKRLSDDVNEGMEELNRCVNYARTVMAYADHVIGELKAA